MSKSDTEWPQEAKICEALYHMAIILRDDHIIEKYEAGEDVGEQAEQLFSSGSNNCLSVLTNACFDTKHELPSVVTINDIIQSLSDLGKILAESVFWERYNQVADLMGTTCPVSFVVARSLLQRDPLAQEIINSLGKLKRIKEAYDAKYSS